MNEESVENAGTQRAKRSGFVAFIGAPNAGKSTLLNRLVGSKVSIVSHKVQTTRTLIRGVAMVGNAQIVFMDTPGIFQPKRRLDRAMVTTAWGGARDADIVLVLIDARKGIREDEERILEALENVRQPKWLILNKVDMMDPPDLLALTTQINNRLSFDQTFMISALNGSGCNDLLKALGEALPEGPYYYPEDQISDLPMRMLASEITREKIYERLHQELPYATTVETEKWEEKADGSARVEQVIYVERDSQKKIVLGHKGEAIKKISMLARKDISAMAEQKIHLFLFVKVRKNWGDDPARYREMGLDYSD
ncbi:MAG: GTPase Era [Pseudomonadota bacterium]